MGASLRVLVVEDSERDTELLVEALHHGGYDVRHERVDSAGAMESALHHQSWDIVVSDHCLPEFDSFAALRLLKTSGLDVPCIIVSGTIGEKNAVAAMKAGASDYLLKGELARLIPIIERELADRRERRARRSAERQLRERQQQAELELAAAYETTLAGWAHALDLRHQETEGHSRRVTDLTLRVAAMMGVDERELVHLRRGALLHDIGKMAIPDSILLKPSALDPDEWEIMKRHPTYAMDLLSPIDYLQPALDIPYCHHEKWNGTGYPRGLKGEDIPVAARLFAPADIWDALRSDRPYRSAWPIERTRQYIASLSGSHLDPIITVAFLDMLASLDISIPPLVPIDDAETPPRSGTILVVDDLAANAQLLKRWLAADGYHVLTADSGESALTTVATHHPDLVLLDIMIPHPNGLAVCRRIKENPATRDIPVILMTALQRPGVGIGALPLGADDHLDKPFDVYELKRRIRRALRRERSESTPSLMGASALPSDKEGNVA